MTGSPGRAATPLARRQVDGVAGGGGGTGRYRGYRLSPLLKLHFKGNVHENTTNILFFFFFAFKFSRSIVS